MTGSIGSTKTKCIVILSTKSSGSSALQELVCRFAGGQHVTHTRHGESETLFWTKAASILDLPQVRLPDSEVPIPSRRARAELESFLCANIPGFRPPPDTDQLILGGWRDLCLAYSPIFVEKSPHHLHQWSCLELLQKACEELQDIDFRFVGLVRNPMDVMYSAWTRWRVLPEVLQFHWRDAYQNLLRWSELVGKRLTIVRYEDLASGAFAASQLLDLLGLDSSSPQVNQFIHKKSQRKWVTDGRFGFVLDPSVSATAARFQYYAGDLAGHSVPIWPVYSRVIRARHILLRTPRRLIAKRWRLIKARRSQATSA